MRMSFAGTYPIGAEQAFRSLSDFAALEKRARDHGIEIAALPFEGGGVGQRWRWAIGLKGVRREGLVELVALQAPERMGFQAESDGLLVSVQFDIAAAGTDQCQIRTGVELKARGLKARLLLAPLALAQNTLEPKIGRRLDGVLREYLSAC